MQTGLSIVLKNAFLSGELSEWMNGFLDRLEESARLYHIFWRRKWQPTPVFLPGKIPWIKEPGGLQSVGSQRVGHD